MSTSDKPKNKRTINQKYKENDSENDKSRRKVTEKQSVRTSACSRASLGLGLMHVCVFFQATVHLHRLSGLAQWAGVELRGSPSRPVLCQALPRSAACQWVGGGGSGRGQGGGSFISMATGVSEHCV